MSGTLFKKDTETGVCLPVNFCQFFKNTFFVQHLQTVGSETPVVELATKLQH